MTLRTPRWLTVVVLLIAAVLTVAVIVVVRHARNRPSSRVHAESIPASGGAMLSSYTFVPKGSGPFPLVVMPAAWGSGAASYAFVGADLAKLGFVVVAYGQRGFGGSTGLVDFAGTDTRTDVSTVITWARAHLPVNDKGVGAVGVSYGAGISLLAAEHDPRITAVAALSGWSDFAQAFAPGGTVSEEAYQWVFAAQKITTARATPDIGRLIGQYAKLDGAAVDATVQQLSPPRSPISGVATLNKRHTAVMLASTYQDSIAPPADLIAFYGKLTGPKRLELAVGDHGGSALGGMRGSSSTLWTNVGKWVEHYLLGRDTGINTQQPVQLQDARTQTAHAYRDWAATGHDTTSYLTGARGTSTTPGAAWTRSITAGVDTVADAGQQQFTTGLPYRFPTVSEAAISRTAGAVWDGPAFPAATLVSGVARVHSAVTLTAQRASLFAYLYDVDAAGTGTLMTYGTATIPGGGAGRTRDADIDLQPIAWTVAAGHHVALVLDTVDPRYLGQSVKGSTVTFSSTATDPATVRVPVG